MEYTPDDSQLMLLTGNPSYLIMVSSMNTIDKIYKFGTLSDDDAYGGTNLVYLSSSEMYLGIALQSGTNSPYLMKLDSTTDTLTWSNKIEVTVTASTKSQLYNSCVVGGYLYSWMFYEFTSTEYQFMTQVQTSDGDLTAQTAMDTTGGKHFRMDSNFCEDQAGTHHVYFFGTERNGNSETDISDMSLVHVSAVGTALTVQ